MFHKELELVPNEDNAYYVGWLDSLHEYKQADLPEDFRSRLWQFCKRSVYQSKGFHGCELCDQIVFGIKEKLGNRSLRLGSAEIRVFGKDGKTYAAPDLIYHYINRHNYCPPDDFVNAVIEGPLPNTVEYKKLFKLKGYW